MATSEIKVKVSADTGEFNLDSANKSLSQLQRESAQAKAELAKLQAEFQETKNNAVQAGTALDKSVGEDFKRKISAARTEVSRLNAELYKGVANSVSSANNNAAKSFDNLTISAAQAQASLRTLPAQFSDIFVSLQGGQNPLTVLLQQGSQIKDSFGGLGNTFKVLGPIIGSFLTSPLALAAAALGALALAYKQGSEEADAFRQSLILTGNAAGATTNQLAGLAKQLDQQSFGTTTAQAAEALNALAKTGEVGRANLADFAEAAIAASNAFGIAIDEIAENFKKLGEDPTKAAAKLNESMNFLTASVYAQIKAAQDLGDVEKAASIAQGEYAKALKSRADTIRENLGYLESAWRRVTAIARESWDAMLNVGRETSVSTKIANIQSELSKFSPTENRPAMVAAAQRMRDELQSLQETERLAKRAGDAQAERVRQQAQGIKAIDAVTEANKKSLTKQQELNKALQEYDRNIEKIRKADPNNALLDPAKIAAAKAGISASILGAGAGAGAAKKEAQIRADLANRESELQKQSLNAFKYVSDEYKRLYSENLITIEQYYAQQEELIRNQQKTDQEAFLERERQLLAEKERLKKGGADPKEILKVEEAIQKSITENQAKQLGYQTQLNSLSAQQRRDTEKYEQTMRSISAEWLKQQNLSGSAEAIEIRRLSIAQKYAAQLAQASAEGNQQLVQRIQQLQEFEEASANLAVKQAEQRQLLIENDIQQADIQRQRQQGLISNVEAEQRLLELKREQTQAQIALNEAILATGQVNGQNLSPAQLNELANATAKLKVEMASLTPAIVDVGTAFKTSFQDKIAGALTDVLTGTRSFKDAFKSLLASIAQDIIRSNISKLVAGIFGGALTGGAKIGGINPASGEFFGSLGFSEGGQVRGPGTSTSDSIPARLSNGEFVVKASAVKSLGVDTLQMINRGLLPVAKAFKNGGLVTNSRPPRVQRFAEGGLARSNGSQDVNIQVVNQSSQPVRARQEQDPRTGVIQLILEDLNRGGPISRGINGITGTGRAVTR